MRAVVYPRVSSALQRDRDTIASQLRTLPAFVATMGWTLVRPADSYVDDGFTAKAGKLDARRGLAALLRDAAAGVFEVVVVVDQDRITRAEDITERGAILGAFQRAGVKIAIAPTGQVLDLATSSGDLLATLHGFFAAEANRKHRERVTQGRITAVSRGRKPGGLAPYWLTFDRVSGTWHIHPERGPITVEMFERVAAGESCRAISDDLHARGIPRPRGEWARSRVVRIIRSRTCLGEWIVDKKRGLAIAVPALIDEALWQRAQLALDRSGHRGLRKTRHNYLLEGLGVCGRCGSPMLIRSRAWDKRRSGRFQEAAYMCRSRRFFRAGGPRCEAPIMLVADSDARAWDALHTQLEEQDLAAAIAGLLTDRSADRATWAADAAEYQRKLRRLDDVESKLLARFTRGTIGEAAMDAELARIGRERVGLREQLAAAGRASAAADASGARLRDARAILAQLRDNLGDAPFALRRALVERLIPVGGAVLDAPEIRLTLLVPRSPVVAGMRPRLVDAIGNESVHETHLRIRVVA